MKIIELIQGSPEWHAHRAKRFNASDAPAMKGVSKYKSRTDLLKELSTGITPEIDPATQRRFDDGHLFEELARRIAEEVVGEPLYPLVGSETIDDLPLSASFDGITVLHEACFEHKTLNNELAESLDAGVIPDEYHWQIEQGLLLSGADRCLFMASKWEEVELHGEAEIGRRYEFIYDESNEPIQRFVLVDEKHAWYEPRQEVRAKLIAGWKQFAEDVANYQHVEAKPEAVAAPIEALPALLVQVEGRVVATNMDAFKAKAGEFIASIKTELVDDQDFADADKMVKFLADGEKQLALVKQQAQAQAADIDAVFRAIDDISAKMRDKRLALDRLVKSEKENRKARILNEAKAELTNHLNLLNERLGMEIMPDTALTDGRFAEAIKGLKTLDSMRDKLSAALANAKIESNEVADRIELNAKAAKDHMHLLPDFAGVCTKPTDDFAALLALRIQQDEQRKDAERERIRQEEAMKAGQAANDQRGKMEGTQLAAPGATELPAASATSTPPITPEQTVMDAEADIREFVAARYPEKQRGLVRAGIVEFLKTYGYIKPMRAAA